MQPRVWRQMRLIVDIMDLKWRQMRSILNNRYYGPQMTSAEVDSGFYPPQMERRDWSDSFVYVTMYIVHGWVRMHIVI